MFQFYIFTWERAGIEKKKYIVKTLGTFGRWAFIQTYKKLTIFNCRGLYTSNNKIDVRKFQELIFPFFEMI